VLLGATDRFRLALGHQQYFRVIPLLGDNLKVSLWSHMFRLP
jgi:hypothetical protein